MQPSPEVKGLKIRTFNLSMILIAVLLCLGLLLAMEQVRGFISDLSVDVTNYIELDNNADMVGDASDYLTEQVRLFVQTGDLKHAELYFEEVNVARRREIALTNVRTYSGESSLWDVYLESAVEASNTLMRQELYGMKLVCAANGYPASAIPPEVEAVTLSPEDAALSPEAMTELARTMMFDDTYETAKSSINAYLSHFTESILNVTETSMVRNLDHLAGYIRLEQFLIVALIMLTILVFLFLTFRIAKPLSLYPRFVREQLPFPYVGAYEFRYLAKVYNDIYDHNQIISANEAYLRHKAEHDALTGLLNRSVFEQIPVLLEGHTVPLALMLFDIDQFKEVNDRDGHLAGDRLLMRVAALLRETFRPEDYLFRIGGDEFAVIVMNLPPVRGDVPKEKVARLNEMLLHPGDDSPPVSLSVGVAFSESGYREELYRQADEALYWVKRNGRRGVKIHNHA